MADTGFHILSHRVARAKREAQREAEAAAKAAEQRERADAANGATGNTQGDSGENSTTDQTTDGTTSRITDPILSPSLPSSAEAGNQLEPIRKGPGGKRAGAGRKLGSVNKLGKRAQRALTASPTMIAAREFVAFKGDGLEFLRWCYQNTTLPVAFRAECAAKAAAYERPKLMTTAITGKDGGPILLEQIAAAAMEKRDKLREQQQTPAPEADALTVH